MAAALGARRPSRSPRYRCPGHAATAVRGGVRAGASRRPGSGRSMVTGASGAGKTSLLQAGLVPALARGVQVPGAQAWPVVSLTATERPLTGLAAGLAALADADPDAIRQRLARAPGEAHLLIREITGQAGEAVRLPAGLLAACTLAGQSLTRGQWAGYAGTQPFQQVCPAS